MIVLTRLTLVTVLLRHNPLLQRLKWTSVFRLLCYSVKHKMRSASCMQFNTHHTDARNMCSFSGHGFFFFYQDLPTTLPRFPFLPLFLSPLLQMLACQNEASVSTGSRKDTDAKLPHPHLDMVIS